MSTTAGFIAGRMSRSGEVVGLEQKVRDAELEADNAAYRGRKAFDEMKELAQRNGEAAAKQSARSLAAREVLANLCDLAATKPEEALALLRNPSRLRESYDERRLKYRPIYEDGRVPQSTISTSAGGLFSTKNDAD